MLTLMKVLMNIIRKTARLCVSILAIATVTACSQKYSCADFDQQPPINRIAITQNGAVIIPTKVEIRTRSQNTFIASEIQLAQKKFDLMYSGTYWSGVTDEYPAVQLAISKDPDFFDNLHFNSHSDSPETIFAQASGYVENAGALNTLGAGKSGHNYIVGERFGMTCPKFRATSVVSIMDRDHLSKLNLLDDRNVLYMAIKIDEGQSWTSPTIMNRPDKIDLFVLKIGY